MRALQLRAVETRRCYEAALHKNSTLAGKMMVRLRVAESGSLCSAEIGDSTLADEALGACVVRVFRASESWPAPRGGCVDASIPVVFTWSDAGAP